MRITTTFAIATFSAFATFACRDSARVGGPWGPASRGGQAAQEDSPKQPRSSAQTTPVAPGSTELGRHPTRAEVDEAGPGPKAGVQLAPDRRPSPGTPTGMGGGPSVTGRAGNQFAPAGGGHETR
jgi:hypothetical protein